MRVDRRSLAALGLRECVEVVELADLCAKLEEEARNGGDQGGGTSGMGAQVRLDSLRAGMRLLLTTRFADGDDLFRAEGEDEADRFRAIREGCRQKEFDKRQLTL